jgi:hypothetical protein
VSRSHYCGRSGNFAHGIASADHQEIISDRQIGPFVHLNGAILFDGVLHLYIIAQSDGREGGHATKLKDGPMRRARIGDHHAQVLALG